MKIKRRNNQVSILIFLLLVLVIGVGYAYLTSSLSITGAANVAGNTWDIHFANLQVSTGSVDATTPAEIDANDNTLINYSVLLGKPGDFYEFTVDMVNAGSLPAKITVLELNGITLAVEDVIDYSIVYTNSNSPVAVNDILNAQSSKNIKVRVYYKEDIANEELLATNEDLTLTFDVTVNQSDEEEITTDSIIQQLKTENSSCFTKYEGQVTDQVGQTVTSQNVYFNKCADKRNIIFGGFCWQMIRTTETGGIKMIYNGEPVDGKCESTRGDHKGIVIYGDEVQSINSSYLYGNSFTYNTSTRMFILIDETTATWSDSTYENLLGKYTCKSNSNTCNSLYQINGYKSNTDAYLSYYGITDTKYAQIGTSTYNANLVSSAMVGYMFNKAYVSDYIDPGTTEYKYGSSFTYDQSTNTYTLSGTIQNISDWNTYWNNNRYTALKNTHYTCWNTSGTCDVISYIFFTTNNQASYYQMSDGKGINDIINEMLLDDNVNRYNSSIKGIIDAWYAQNLSSKTNMFEDIVYCNDRSILDYGGYNSEGGRTDLNASLFFKNHNDTISLVCANETDQFAVSNNKAKLNYPVALLTNEEYYNINTPLLMKSGYYYWTISPYGGVSLRYINTDGQSGNSVPSSYGAIRVVISLASGARLFSGSGSETDPWIVR